MRPALKLKRLTKLFYFTILRNCRCCNPIIPIVYNNGLTVTALSVEIYYLKLFHIHTKFLRRFLRLEGACRATTLCASTSVSSFAHRTLGAGTCITRSLIGLKNVPTANQKARLTSPMKRVRFTTSTRLQ